MEVGNPETEPKKISFWHETLENMRQMELSEIAAYFGKRTGQLNEAESWDKMKDDGRTSRKQPTELLKRVNTIAK